MESPIVTIEVQGVEDSVLGSYLPLITAIFFYLVTTILTYIEFSEAQDSNSNNNSTSVSQHSEEPTAGRRHYRHRPDYVGSVHHNSSPHAGGNQPSDNTKANGESNRRLFYKYLLQSQISRLIFLPMSFFFPAAYQITSIVSQTLPTLSFAISYAILILFYAQVTITASGTGATSTVTTGGSGSAVVAANGSGSGVASAAASSIRGVFDLVQMEKIVTRWSYGIYASVVALNCVVPILASKALQIILWSILSIIYAILFFSMAFYGSKIMTMLKGNMADGLAFRLVSMSTVCCVAFLIRALLFSWDVYSAIYKVGRFFPRLPDWWNGNYASNEFGRNVMGYLLIEWLPSTVVLVLMHKKRREPNSSGRNAGAEETVAALEAGQYSPLVLDQHGHYPQETRKNVSIGTGVKRSYSANGGVAIPNARTQPYVQHHQNQRAVASSFASSMGGMISRSGSGGRSSEAASLLGGKSQSAIATPSYGASDDS